MVMKMRDLAALTHNIFNIQSDKSFQLDPELNETLITLASQENCSPNELASRLLRFAIEERRKIQYNSIHWQDLSIREQQVAIWVCKGFSNQEIALKLGIATETVKTHVRNILGKFGLRKKQALIMELAGWDFSAWQY
jgi:DNA-binding CsgD family transcriptional regulator